MVRHPAQEQCTDGDQREQRPAPRQRAAFRLQTGIRMERYRRRLRLPATSKRTAHHNATRLISTRVTSVPPTDNAGISKGNGKGRLWRMARSMFSQRMQALALMNMASSRSVIDSALRISSEKISVAKA